MRGDLGCSGGSSSRVDGEGERGGGRNELSAWSSRMVSESGGAGSDVGAVQSGDAVEDRRRS